MKHYFVAIFTTLLLSNASTAQQDSGIHFINAANWQEVLDKAKAENKFILVDCYATWCGPCKYMDKTIFPLAEVGAFVNEKFIPVKIQFDKTKNDAPAIQNWYKDAKMMEDTYSVSAYPTYLFFSPQGEVLHRFSATTKTGADFISKVKQALDPSTQYYKTVMEYKKHLGDSAFLRNAIKVAQNLSDRKMAAEIGNFYIDCINPMLKENLHVLRSVTVSSNDKGFELFLKNADKINNIMGNNFAQAVVSGTLYNDHFQPYFETDKEIKNWDEFSGQIKKKYYILEPRFIDIYESLYYRTKKNIPAFEKALTAYAKKYYDQLSEASLNEYAWAVFQESNSKEVLETALAWSKRSIELVDKSPGSNYCNFMDTYANLLYKLGRKEEAIEWVKKALDVATNDKKSKVAISIADNLAKMEKGERTW